MDGLADAVPGGVVSEKRREADTAFFTVEAMGQRMACRINVLGEAVVATVQLPALLEPFAGTIQRKLEEHGPKMLR